MPLYIKAKDEITRMLKIGVISPVGHLTEWYAPVAVTLNPNAGLPLIRTQKIP